MADVDTSFYTKAPPQQAGGGMATQNPLDALNTFMTIQGKLNQNALFQQQFNANAAFGEIMRNSVGPDGQPDYARASVALSLDPRTAFKAADFISQMLLREQTQAQIVGTKLENTKKQFDVMGQVALGSLPQAKEIMSDKGLSPEEQTARMRKLMFSGIADLYAQGILTKEQALGTADGKPGILGQLPNNARGMYDMILRTIGQSESASKNLANVLGSIQQIDYGGGVLTQQAGGLVSPQTLSVTPKTPTPAEFNALTPRELTGAEANAQGVPPGTVVQTPRFAVAPMISGSGQQIAGTGPGATPAPAPGAPAPGGSASSMGPVERQFRSGRVEGMNKYEGELRDLVKDGNLLMTTLDHVEEAMKKTAVGGGMDVRAGLAKFVQGIGTPLVESGAMDKDKLRDIVDKVSGGNLGAAQDLVKSTMNNTTNLLRQSIGAGKITNLEFAKFGEANPNISTDERAIRSMFKYMRFVQELRSEELKGYNEYVAAGNDPGSWASHWQNQLEKTGIVRYK